eukprot:CAMPEP_0170475524 /NCGR_PEP_ID=MMETSP0123-20130129/17164_1 /TAXON_ID=182087 /ORGANISM="Favella ehrenbergii, Strain Fehren 1" /LENGTH=65 /DNA_ID=CAMNT_0010746099 /DNA_START=1101 /DNA_END=1298 /DNA_ORIENTATION=-
MANANTEANAQETNAAVIDEEKEEGGKKRGFFKRIFNRDALGDRAVRKFSIPSQSKKICAFSDDE